MRHILTLTIILLLVLQGVSAQGWSTPMNISNMGKPAMDPHFVVDHDGVIHAVWATYFSNPGSVIHYAKSLDNGNSWNVPEIIFNDTISKVNRTHIVCNSLNQLFVSFDEDVQNTFNTKVMILMFDGNNWSLPFMISLAPGSYFNNIIIDNTDRLYCFWNGWYANGNKIFYRYMENSLWSELIIPYYTANDFYSLSNIRVDKNNNLHGAGYFSNKQNYINNYDDNYYYFYYKSTNQWALGEKIDNSPYTAWYGNAIALDSNNLPHFCWGGNAPNPEMHIQNFTSFVYPTETGWLPPDTVEKNNHAELHTLLIDNSENKNLIMRYQSSTDQTYSLFHFKHISNEWIGTEIDSSGLISIAFDFQLINDYEAGLIESKYGIIENDTIRDIFFSKYNLFTNVEEKDLSIINFLISPNPLTTKTDIIYSLQFKCHVLVEIFDLNGKLIERLIDQTQSPGRYCHTWQCTSLNRKEVKAGVYIVRLQAGRYVYSRKVVKL